MDKLDLCLIPLVFLLRIAYFILQLVSAFSRRHYNYWFHSSNNIKLRSDFMSWSTYALVHCGLWITYALYLSIEWLQVLPYRNPVVSTFYPPLCSGPVSTGRYSGIQTDDLSVRSLATRRMQINLFIIMLSGRRRRTTSRGGIVLLNLAVASYCALLNLPTSMTR